MTDTPYDPATRADAEDWKNTPEFRTLAHLLCERLNTAFLPGEIILALNNAVQVQAAACVAADREGAARKFQLACIEVDAEDRAARASQGEQTQELEYLRRVRDAVEFWYTGGGTDGSVIAAFNSGFHPSQPVAAPAAPSAPPDWRTSPEVRGARKALLEADDAYYHEMPTDGHRQFELEKAYGDALDALCDAVAHLCASLPEKETPQ